jgi:hypothetical protein
MQTFLWLLRRPAEIVVDPLECAMRRILGWTPNSCERELAEMSRSIQRALGLDKPPTWSPEAERNFIDARGGSSGRE